MASTIPHVIIAGATGSFGGLILKALLDEPYFKVNILSRTTSSAQLVGFILELHSRREVCTEVPAHSLERTACMGGEGEPARRRLTGKCRSAIEA